MFNLVNEVWATTLELAPSDDFTGLDSITLSGLFSGLITILFIFAAVVCFIFLVWGGIKWISSGGDSNETAAARGMITAAIIGLIIVFAVWAILSLVEIFFGVDLTNFTLPTVGGEGTTGETGGGEDDDEFDEAYWGDYCMCWNGECVPEGTTGPNSLNPGTCYLCSGGSWTIDYAGGSSYSCPPISCQTCP